MATSRPVATSIAIYTVPDALKMYRVYFRDNSTQNCHLKRFVVGFTVTNSFYSDMLLLR